MNRNTIQISARICNVVCSLNLRNTYWRSLFRWAAFATWACAIRPHSPSTYFLLPALNRLKTCQGAFPSRPTPTNHENEKHSQRSSFLDVHCWSWGFYISYKSRFPSGIFLAVKLILVYISAFVNMRIDCRGALCSFTNPKTDTCSRFFPNIEFSLVLSHLSWKFKWRSIFLHSFICLFLHWQPAQIVCGPCWAIWIGEIWTYKPGERVKIVHIDFCPFLSEIAKTPAILPGFSRFSS